MAYSPIAPGPITKYFIGGHLIVLRKLLSQKSEHEREHDGVYESRRWASLSRHVNTLRAWWQGEQHTWAQGQEQNGGHDEVGSRQHETHGFRDQRIDEEKHECVEKNGGTSCESITELNAGTIGTQQNTWAERKEKGRWNRDLL